MVVLFRSKYVELWRSVNTFDRWVSVDFEKDYMRLKTPHKVSKLTITWFEYNYSILVKTTI